MNDYSKQTEMVGLRIIILLALIISIGIQCTNKDPRAKIISLEQEISSDQFTFDQKGIQAADELIGAYIRYAEENPVSAEAPDYLYHAAELSLSLNRTQQALEIYNKIIYKYPDYNKSPECLFLLAFIYENNLQNFGKAKELYESFISKYPGHDFADDAAISIENMGKSPEELIREFEEKTRLADSAAHI